jgi:hypothetical protein
MVFSSGRRLKRREQSTSEGTPRRSFEKVGHYMRDHAEFKIQLARQLGFLERSCASFDAGFLDEAVRIATAVRVLLHDTRSSTSLLKHLNAKTINILSTCKPVSEPPKLQWMDCQLTRITGNGLIAKLDQASFKKEIPFDEWWNQLVLVIRDARITRKDLVLFAANKDGGAHVDNELTPEFESLMTNSYFKDNSQEPAKIALESHLVSLRQIGFEVLNSPELRKLVS